MSADYELDKRLRELEHKAVIRKIWTDFGKKIILAIPFVAGGFLLLMSHDNQTAVAGVFIMFGGLLQMYM
jgi:hypothetical protein